MAKVCMVPFAGYYEVLPGNKLGKRLDKDDPKVAAAKATGEIMMGAPKATPASAAQTPEPADDERLTALEELGKKILGQVETSQEKLNDLPKKVEDLVTAALEKLQETLESAKKELTQPLTDIDSIKKLIEAIADETRKNGEILLTFRKVYGEENALKPLEDQLMSLSRSVVELNQEVKKIGGTTAASAAAPGPVAPAVAAAFESPKMERGSKSLFTLKWLVIAVACVVALLVASSYLNEWWQQKPAEVAKQEAPAAKQETPQIPPASLPEKKAETPPAPELVPEEKKVAQPAEQAPPPKAEEQKQVVIPPVKEEKPEPPCKISGTVRLKWGMCGFVAHRS